MNIFKDYKFWIILLTVIYSFIGIFLLPKIVLEQIDKYTTENFDQKILIQNITVNPFTFNLTVHNLQIQDKKTKVNLIGADELSANIDIFSLMTNNINLDSIELIHPKIDAVLDKNGNLNLADIKPINSSTNKKDTKLPYFSIDELILENATINFTDKTLPEEFKNR